MGKENLLIHQFLDNLGIQLTFVLTAMIVQNSLNVAFRD